MSKSLQPWFSQGLMKTHHCGQVTEDAIGKSVILVGWLQKYRDLGGLHFIDLRDKQSTKHHDEVNYFA